MEVSENNFEKEIKKEIKNLDLIKNEEQMNNNGAELITRINMAVQQQNITEKKAEEYKKEVENRIKENERIERTETREVINDYTNPRENVACYDMETYQCKINEEREKNQREDNNDKDKQSIPKNKTDIDERTF